MHFQGVQLFKRSKPTPKHAATQPLDQTRDCNMTYDYCTTRPFPVARLWVQNSKLRIASSKLRAAHFKFLLKQQFQNNTKPTIETSRMHANSVDQPMTWTTWSMMRVWKEAHKTVLKLKKALHGSKCLNYLKIQFAFSCLGRRLELLMADARCCCTYKPHKYLCPRAFDIALNRCR